MYQCLFVMAISAALAVTVGVVVGGQVQDLFGVVLQALP